MGATPENTSRFGDMVSNSGLTPWHAMGTVIDDPSLTATQALEIARLNWDVRKGVMIDAETFEPIPNRHLLKADFADGTSATIGLNDDGEGVPQIVSDTYEIIQNSVLAEMAEALGLTAETAGSMWDGRFVWLCVRLGESPRFDGAEKMHRWLLLSTWHGSGTLQTWGVNTRPVCENTIQLGQSTGQLFHSIRHTSSAEERIEEAKQALVETYNAFDELDVEIAKLIDQPYTTQDMRRELVPAVFGPMPQGEDVSERKLQAAADKRRQLRRIWDSDTCDTNKWGAVMAVNEYEQHVQGKPSFERTARKFIQGDFPLTRKALAVVS